MGAFVVNDGVHCNGAGLLGAACGRGIFSVKYLYPWARYSELSAVLRGAT